jgi:ABC-type transport system involved in multi-copper enzyme maturation permease subunit
MIPIWLLSIGATFGLLILLAVYGVSWLVAPKFARDVPSILKEGVLQYVFYLLLLLAAFTAVFAFRVPYQRLIASVGRISEVGPRTLTYEIPAGAVAKEIPIEFRATELQSLKLESDRDLLVLREKEDIAPLFQVRGGEPTTWVKSASGNNPFHDVVHHLYVANEGDAPAELTIHMVTNVEVPQVYAIPITAVCVLALFGLYFLQRLGLPRISMIAAATAKQAVAQPIYPLALAIGATLLIASVYVPYNTFGEDVKMLKNSGLPTVLVLSVIVAVWTASVSVADEIEGRTALTLLSKPVGRRQFVLGKVLGVVWPTVLMFILLGTIFLISVSYKVVYDARESAEQTPTWQACYAEMVQIVPGLALALMETIVLASISVAISTRLPMLANLIICTSIYALGHLVPLIVQSSAAKFEIVRFFGLLIATVLPVLDHFKVEAAVAGGTAVPLSYLAWALLYCLVYSTIMMLLSLAMFEDRDLA